MEVEIFNTKKISRAFYHPKSTIRKHRKEVHFEICMYVQYDYNSRDDNMLDDVFAFWSNKLYFLE